MFTAVIVDDHPVITGAIRTLLERSGDFHVLAECADGATGLTSARHRRPDLLIIDLDLPRMNGLDVIRHLRQDGSTVAILMISGADDLLTGAQARRAGADGFVHKGAVTNDIVTAAQRVVRGQTYFDPAVIGAVLPAWAAHPPGPLRCLGRREFEVFRGLAQGRSNLAIARDLAISNKTVSAHKRNLMDKLGLATIRDLIELAIRHRIID